MSDAGSLSITSPEEVMLFMAIVVPVHVQSSDHQIVEPVRPLVKRMLETLVNISIFDGSISVGKTKVILDWPSHCHQKTALQSPWA